MISEQPKSPPGLPLTINFKIPAYWTPEQALAVFELLDDLRQRNIAEWKSSPLWRRPQWLADAFIAQGTDGRQRPCSMYCLSTPERRACGSVSTSWTD